MVEDKKLTVFPKKIDKKNKDKDTKTRLKEVKKKKNINRKVGINKLY